MYSSVHRTSLCSSVSRHRRAAAMAAMSPTCRHSARQSPACRCPVTSTRGRINARNQRMTSSCPCSTHRRWPRSSISGAALQENVKNAKLFPQPKLLLVVKMIQHIPTHFPQRGLSVCRLQHSRTLFKLFCTDLGYVPRP